MTVTTCESTNMAQLTSLTGGRVPNTDTTALSRSALWTGRAMSGLVVAFLVLASAVPKIFLPEIATESMRQLGFPEHHLLLLACIEVVGTLLYAFPRTASLGAVVLTGLLGGAVASHLRLDAPMFSHTLFPVYVGVFMWGGLWLRHAKVRQLLPLGS
jgi:hypothetical protein